MRPILSGPLRVLVVAAVSVLVAGCSSGGSGTAAPASGPTAAAAPASAAPTGGDRLIDCSFLTPAELEALIGASPAGRQEGDGCTWEDPQTSKSVTIEASGPDSAPGGKLPAWDPALGPERTLPGGLRDVNGAVQFVCGGTRWCQVQVATAGDAAGDRAKSLALVAKVRAKVG